MAFGSIVDWRTAPRRIVRSIFGALNELEDYRVIVSTKAPPEGVDLGPHVLLTKWAPQIALLGDARTRLFISHGGLKSVKEAICGRTPVLYLPLFAEQAHNARQVSVLFFVHFCLLFSDDQARPCRHPEQVHAEQSGRLTGDAASELFRATFRDLSCLQLLNNPRFKQRAVAFNAQFLDHPLPPLDVAVHSANRILRRGALGFERKGRRLSWAEFTYASLLLPLVGAFLLVNRK